MTKDELIEKTDTTINELVYPKWNLLKAYNYYNGVRDKDQFKYLEEKFGTSTPTELNFTPLIKKHIDALVGEYLSMPIIPKVYCKDSETISNMDREKQLKVVSEIHSFLKGHLKLSILKFMNGKDTDDPLIAELIEDIKDSIDNTFVSEYEAAALNVVDYIIQSRDTDLIPSLRNLIMDLLITGFTFYKVEPTVSGDNIKIRVLNPLNTFIDRNLESPYIKNSYRAVVRNWMSKNEILNKYGKKMSQKDRDLLESHWQSIYDNSMYYVRMLNDKTGRPMTDGLMAGVEVTPGYPTVGHHGINWELIPVYEVEWLEVDKNFVMLRYETIRIGEEIYILTGKVEDVQRSKSNPNYCGLSINGVYFLNRSSEPYSMVLACAHLQD